MAKQQVIASDSVSKLSTESQQETGTKTLYGSVWIQDNQLIQDQILVMPGGKISENTVVLIPDVLEELLNGTKAKGSGKYFFWPVTMTDISNDDIENLVDYECPNIFYFQHVPNLEERLKKGTSAWAEYWAQKWKEADENRDREMVIQKKIINLPGTSWIDQEGNVRKIEDKQIQNTSLGDIENLLSIF